MNSTVTSDAALNEGLGNLQMAMFAAFGGSASLISAAFPPSPGDRLQAAAASARTLAEDLEAAVRGTATADDDVNCQVAKHNLMSVFASTPFRPTGLATADQGLASVVQLLEWCTALIADTTTGTRTWTEPTSATVTCSR